MKTRQPCPMCDKLVPKSQIDYADYVDVDPRDGYEHHFHRVCWGHYQVSNRAGRVSFLGTAVVMVEGGKIRSVIGITDDPLATAVAATTIRREEAAAGVARGKAVATEGALRMAGEALIRGLPDPEAMAAEAAREAEVVAPRRPGIVGLDGRELQN